MHSRWIRQARRMHWTNWQDYGAGEWVIVAFGAAASIWLLYLVWWFVVGCISAALLLSGKREWDRRLWRWFRRVTPGG